MLEEHNEGMWISSTLIAECERVLNGAETKHDVARVEAAVLQGEVEGQLHRLLYVTALYEPGGRAPCTGIDDVRRALRVVLD